MQGVYSWLKTIVIFMIFLTIISNLLGKSDFKKYINVVTGLLLVLVVMNPILKLISFDNSFEYYLDSVSFGLKTTEVGDEMLQAEKKQRAVILQRYKTEIVEQIKELLKAEELYLVEAEVTINEDLESEDYAKIKNLFVTASYYMPELEQSTKIETVHIEKIKVDTQTISQKKEKKSERQDFLSPMEIRLKNKLSDFYNMNENNINISIQGGKYE